MSGRRNWADVREILDQRGLWFGDGVTRRVRAQHCKRCGRAVLVGLEGERCQSVAVCDPTPLGALGEAQALLAGAPTFDLAWRGGRYEIDYRYAEVIKAYPAGIARINSEVIAAHQCAVEYGADMRGPAIESRTTDNGTESTPPF